MRTTPEIEALIKEIRSRADRPRALHPWDYATARAKKAPDERGYQAETIAIVAAALHLPTHTVKNWGAKFTKAPPQYAPILYRLAALEEIEKVTARLPETQRAAIAQLLP